MQTLLPSDLDTPIGYNDSEMETLNFFEFSNIFLKITLTIRQHTGSVQVVLVSVSISNTMYLIYLIARVWGAILNPKSSHNWKIVA